MDRDARSPNIKPALGVTIIVVITLLHFNAALLIGERPITSYFTMKWAVEALAFLTVPFLFWLSFKLVEAFKRQEKSPIAYISAALSADRQRFVTAAILLACYALISRAYRAIKVAIPRLEEFWADPMFVAWDRAIFGTDPWTITHAMFGPDATRVLDITYATWFLVIMFVYGFCAFSKDRIFQLRACFTYLLIWIVLGNGLAVLWSSVGPVYYEHFFGIDQFAPLMERLDGTAANALRIQAYLLRTTGDESIGTGISAMPSIHCAMTMLFVIIAWHRRGFGPVFLAALAYHLIIMIGSIHLAWHYAVDGVISSLLVPVLWFAAKGIFRPKPASRITPLES